MAERVLWILGAGASKHLGLPLLMDFHTFVSDVANHKNNQETGDAPGREAAKWLGEQLSCTSGNIETLLGRYQFGSNESRRTREAIRWCFQKRHDAIVHKRDIPYKYKHYAYLLSCIEPDDSIVTFNYDLAIERTLLNARRPDKQHRKQPRIPGSCIPRLIELGYNWGSVKPGKSRLPATFSISLLKVHGSLNWELDVASGTISDLGLVDPAPIPYIVYPDPAKNEASEFEIGRKLLKDAEQAITKADTIVIAGYSCPESDREGHPVVSALFQSIPKKSLHVISPSKSPPIESLGGSAKAFRHWDSKFEEVFSSHRVGEFLKGLGRSCTFA